jgi:hypothetical protein
MQVYTVWGLGFGDDEDHWELCSTHATQAGAEAAKQSILDEDAALEVEVQVQEVLQ